MGKDINKNNPELEKFEENPTGDNCREEPAGSSGEGPPADDALIEESTGVEAEEEAPAEEADPALLRKLLSEQTTRAEDYYDRLIRLQADYENFRRRTRQEKEEFYKYASEKLISALLPVLDNFERALTAEGDSIEAFKSGVQMIYKQLQEVLAAEGVKPVPAVGEQFDPLKHEAALKAESAEHPDNTVLEELRRGYYLKDKVIRPAMVKVAKSS